MRLTLTLAPDLRYYLECELDQADALERRTLDHLGQGAVQARLQRSGGSPQPNPLLSHPLTRLQGLVRALLRGAVRESFPDALELSWLRALDLETDLPSVHFESVRIRDPEGLHRPQGSSAEHHRLIEALEAYVRLHPGQSLDLSGDPP